MSYERKVGERGQITLPKKMREELGIAGGDKVVIQEESGRIEVEKKDRKEELVEGYRKTKERDRNISEEMLKASGEVLEE
ncbi:MAG: AbrB/MazE/SpoVT family DNA-binding domain-containing protein [Candidatus Nanohaloarchaeota archaeon QJJ-9]|nr:AbrB/MazE/SpoVT family DNA-binding domain-containing protein [Candidatus Nanohaloarchaeota archaeon QJJ-9]